MPSVGMASRKRITTGRKPAHDPDLGRLSKRRLCRHHRSRNWCAALGRVSGGASVTGAVLGLGADDRFGVNRRYSSFGLSQKNAARRASNAGTQTLIHDPQKGSLQKAGGFAYGRQMGKGARAMTVSKAMVLSVALMTLSGCGVLGGNGNGFLGIGRLFGDGGASQAGLPYRSSLRRGDDTRDFTVRVEAGGVGVAEARESVRFPATRYCLETFGGSDVDWVIDPTSGDWAFERDGQAMIFQGRCTAR